MNYADARMIVETALDWDYVPGATNCQRSYPKVRSAMELIREGAIGQPILAYASAQGGFTVKGGWRT